MISKKAEQFLLQRVANVRHSGRTFYEHLKGVYDLLERRGLPDYVCNAGLFHSIYGTNIFQHQSVSLDDRASVVDVIGPQAERLAYVFCSCDRPRALVEAARGGMLVDRRSKEVILLSQAELRDLLDIEIANLQDQGGGPMLERVLGARKDVDVGNVVDG